MLIHRALCSGQVADYFGFQSTKAFIYQVKRVTIGSTEFQSNSSVVLCPLSGGVAGQFGLVIAIYVQDERPLFICKMYQTERFNHHLAAFEVTERRDRFLMVLSPEQVVKHNVFALHSAGFYRAPLRQFCVGWSGEHCAKDELAFSDRKLFFITVKSEIASIVFPF